jgi:hypothetical protein
MDRGGPHLGGKWGGGGSYGWEVKGPPANVV